MSFAPTRRGFKRAAALAGATALFAGTAALLVPLAASADDPAGVDLAVEIPSLPKDSNGKKVVSMPFDDGSKDLRVEVRSDVSSAETATGVTLTFALPAANEAGSVTLADGFADKCTVNADGTGVCKLGDLAPGSIQNLRAFTVHSAVEHPKDPKRIGKIKVSVSSDQTEREPSDNGFEVIARVLKRPGFDLAVWARESDLVVRPGDTGSLDADDFVIENDSASPASGIHFSVFLPNHTNFTGAPKGCEITGAEQREIQCDLPDVTIPGKGKLTAPALPFAVDADAPARAKLKTDVTILAGADRIGAPSASAEEAGDPVLVLAAPSVSDAKAKEYVENKASADNYARFAMFTYADQADLAIALTVPDAKVGGESKVTATVTNKGPWAVDKGVTLDITAPTGTTVLNAGKECQANGKVLTCVVNGKIEAGASVTYTFTLRVDSAKVGEDGKVAVASTQPDPVTANNTAALTVKVIADGGPSASPSPTGGSGGLPTTGTSLTIMGAAAAALLAAGAAFVIVSRRRRATAAGDVE